MSAFHLDVHDAEVVAVENHREAKRLSLRLRMRDGSDALLEFSGVEDVELGPFREQNVLLDLYVWSASREGTSERCRELEIPARCTRAILAGELVLYEIDSSVGLGGYVLAKDARDADGRESNLSIECGR
ncbi:hypothetical protein D187_009602 [Cystobacter fuscus DSM 2262]|uniref:Uncharacterized protein n=1 Tax=Cystobacter fuscus (strain ATCC 25194 / DSM 2262 / NBRC 100088 / M29) TaxID=1242864 RepID=S9NW03_CYSF2|nr:hypothetical protein [Cystobacter fuscus]EPX55096.1 hypothetical protein D187_009602 [Cystobacter fuscus DSM 2262]